MYRIGSPTSYLTQTREREIRALREGMASLGVQEGMILTGMNETVIQEKEGKIEIRSLAQWLLNPIFFSH